MKYIFLFKPDEKHERDLSPLRLVREAFSGRGKVRDFIFKEVFSDDEIKTAVRRYAEKFRKDVCFFACGGNDIVLSMAETLAFSDIPMGIIPFGQNDLARKIYGEDCTPDSVCADMGLFEKPVMRFKKIDVGEANGMIFTNLLSAGFDEKRFSAARRLYEKIPLSRRVSRKIGFACALMSNKKQKAKLSLEVYQDINSVTREFTYEHETEFSLLSIANSGYSEGRKISDCSSLFDGRLEACIISPCSFAEYPYVNEIYKRGVADISDKTKVLTVTGGKISSLREKPIAFLIDGRSHTADEINVAVRRKALKICAPYLNETEK